MKLINIFTQVLVLFVAVMPTFASDETAFSNVSGKVTDPNGAVIAGARVEAVRVGTSIKTVAMTNDDGEFTLQVARGEYTINVTAGGFARHSASVSLRAADEQIQPIVLSVGSAEATVTVNAGTGYLVSDTRS